MPIFDEAVNTIYWDEKNPITKNLDLYYPNVRRDTAIRWSVASGSDTVAFFCDHKTTVKELQKLYTFRDYSELPIQVEEVYPGSYKIGTIFPIRANFDKVELLVDFLKPFFYNHNYTLVKEALHRVRHKLSLEDALANPIETCLNLFPNSILVGDLVYLSREELLEAGEVPRDGEILYEGTVYNTFTDLALALNLPSQPLRERLKAGTPLEDAIALVKDNPTLNTPPISFGEYTFHSRNSFLTPKFYLGSKMTSFWKIDELIGVPTLLAHPDLDPTLKLTLSKRFRWVASDGTIFYYLNQAADYCGLTPWTFKERMEAGESAEELEALRQVGKGGELPDMTSWKIRQKWGVSNTKSKENQVDVAMKSAFSSWH